MYLSSMNRFRLTWSLSLAAFVMLCGCVSTPDSYTERDELKNLTVVFLDDDSLRQQWESLTQRNAVTFLNKANDSIPGIKTVRGFFDFTTNTLYCPKWNFEVCGHELHHAALGHFHSSE